MLQEKPCWKELEKLQVPHSMKPHESTQVYKSNMRYQLVKIRKYVDYMTRMKEETNFDENKSRRMPKLLVSKM